MNFYQKHEIDVHLCLRTYLHVDANHLKFLNLEKIPTGGHGQLFQGDEINSDAISCFVLQCSMYFMHAYVIIVQKLSVKS